MANLQETATWESGIYQLEVTDPVLGGPEGPDNRAPRQLANRTLFLKGQVDAIKAANSVTNQNVANLGTSKEDKSTVAQLVTALSTRIAELEKKSAVFAAGGGMVLWQKPANQIPAGWAEVVNWRGRLPMGWDPGQPEFNTVGNVGGQKDKYLGVDEMPQHDHYTFVNTEVGSGSSVINSGTSPARRFRDSDFSENYEIKSGGTTRPNVGRSSYTGGGAAFSLLNPYRVVMFIEYVG